MPRRDPTTGKFVSGGEISSEDIHTAVGRVNYAIPAADLSGTTVQEDLSGSDTEILDMGEDLESGEIFRPVGLYVTAVARAHTSATAEGAFDASFTLSRDATNPRPGYISSPFWEGSFIAEQDIVDIQASQAHDDSLIYIGQLASEPSASDTVNGTGHGGYNDADRNYIPGTFVGDFDEDDELYAPADLTVDGVSDHGVQLDIVVTMHGVKDDV